MQDEVVIKRLIIAPLKRKYLGTTLTNQNSVQEEIKSRLKSRNACYYLVRNLPVCNAKIQRVRYTEPKLCMLCMGVKLCCSQ